MKNLYIEILASFTADMLAVSFIIFSQIELIFIFAYLFFTKYAFWMGEFVKGFGTILCNSIKENSFFLTLIGAFFSWVPLHFMMWLSAFALWYVSTGKNFEFEILFSMPSELYLPLSITFISILSSIIFFIIKKEYAGPKLGLSILTTIFYPIALIFMALLFGIGLIFLKDSRIAIALLFIFISILDKAIIIGSNKLMPKRKTPGFVKRLAERNKNL